MSSRSPIRRRGEPSERSTDKGTVALKVEEAVSDDKLSNLVRVTIDERDKQDFQAQVELLESFAQLQFKNVREISEKDVDIDGADDGKLRVLERDVRTEVGVLRARSSAVFAQRDDGLFVTLILDTDVTTKGVDADAITTALTLDR